MASIRNVRYSLHLEWNAKEWATNQPVTRCPRKFSPRRLHRRRRRITVPQKRSNRTVVGDGNRAGLNLRGQRVTGWLVAIP